MVGEAMEVVELVVVRELAMEMVVSAEVRSGLVVPDQPAETSCVVLRCLRLLHWDSGSMS